MKRSALFLFALLAIAAVAGAITHMSHASSQSAAGAAPVYVTAIPPGYRDWRFISMAHEEGTLNSFGALLGNDIAYRAFRDGKLPYPDGSMIAALHYAYVPSDENNKIFGQKQSFVPGAPTNIQFMIKDAKKYAATGGWGFGHFNAADGKPGDDALLKTCAPCHAMASRDGVFARYAK
jgi:hypothetical protein